MVVQKVLRFIQKEDSKLNVAATHFHFSVVGTNEKYQIEPLVFNSNT